MTVAPGESRLLIDGALVEGRSGRQLDNIDPFTEEVLGQVSDAEAADMEAGIAAARRACDETAWATDHQLRKTCLLQLQAALESEREALRAELVAEAGTPILLTYGPQLDGPLADTILWPADHIDRFAWERQLPDGSAFGTRSWRKVIQEPVGVVGAIAPWNFPFEIALSKVAQALATGNTVVLKPAPDTPWNATRIGRLAAEQTDLPAGVLNVVTTSDDAVAELLVTDPRVDMVSFTGSTTIGRRIAALAAPMMKRLLLELGGKSCSIVLDDADLASAVPAGAASICVHGGQGCAMPSRLLVPRSRYDEAVELAAAGMRAVPYGDPRDPATLQGPQVSERQRERVLGYIERGVREGARLALGGGRPADQPTGWFVEPTLFADVDSSMAVAQEEIFGPVMVVSPCEDDAEAVRSANDSIYGLGLAVASADEGRAVAVARRIRTGSATINGGTWLGADAPFGGYKASGVGRQNGVEGFAQHTETRTIAGALR